MEIFDLLLSLLGSFVIKVMNRVFGTKIKLGYGGEIVTGLLVLILLVVIVFLSIRSFAVFVHAS